MIVQKENNVIYCMNSMQEVICQQSLNHPCIDIFCQACIYIVKYDIC